jgi:hypothetical protein
MLWLSGCSGTPTEVTGGASDNPNAFAGVFVDQRYEPVDGARVLLIDMERAGLEALGGCVTETTHTDPDGSFLFDSVAPGRYNVEGLAGDTLIGYARNLIKTPGSPGAAGAIAMNRPASLTGTITTNIGDALVVVELDDTHYRLVPDPGGTYRFSLIPHGTFTINLYVIDTSTAEPPVLDTTLLETIESGDSTMIEEVLLDSPDGPATLKRIVLNTTRTGAAVARDVYDFPLLLRLDSSSVDFSVPADGGGDLRFTRGTTNHLPYEVELWDETRGVAVVWVALDTVFGDSVQSITMSRGDLPQAPPGGEGVFSSARGFEAVWHLGEEALGDTGIAGAFIDATGRGYDGDDYVSATGKEGIIGRGQEFDGTDDYILIPQTLQPSGSMTISCWVRSAYVPNTENSGFRIVSTYAENTGNPLGFQVRTYQNDLVFTAGDGTSKNDAQAWDVVSATWQHIVVVYEAGTGAVDFFLNGEKVPTALAPTRPEIVYGDARTYLSHPGSWTVSGHLDEIRLSRRMRSEDWVRLCYENQKQRQTLVE